MNTIQADFPALRTTGMSIAQGRYGQRGNLELVAPHLADGFWVFWFNADDTDGAPVAGAVPGGWSGGLHIPTGMALQAVQVHQQQAAPYHLDVFGRAESGWWRWYWTPEHGFLDGGRQPDCSPVPVSSAPHTTAPSGPANSSGGVVLASCLSTLQGGTTEVITDAGGLLRHRRFRSSDGVPRSDTPLCSRVLVLDADTRVTSVHREGSRPARRM